MGLEERDGVKDRQKSEQRVKHDRWERRENIVKRVGRKEFETQRISVVHAKQVQPNCAMDFCCVGRYLMMNKYLK